MSYEQTASPNLTQDLVVDGLGSWLGMCLAVAEVAGGTTRAYAYAWLAWEDAAYKHADTNLPEGCWVPVFWYGYWNGFPYGHVAWGKRTENQIEIWTSPYTHKPYFDVFSGEINSTIVRVKSLYGMNRFAGWTEDLAGKRFVQPTNVSLGPHQRQVGSVFANYRTGPSTDYPTIYPEGLDANTIIDMQGYVLGQNVEGNSIWFKAAHGAQGYAWSGGFTSHSLSGLKELTYEKQPEKTKREGLSFIDVSAHQGASINWGKVKSAGFTGVIIRAGHVGKSFNGIQPYNLDPNHDRWVAEARHEGLLVGHYWYCYQELDPIVEARAFLKADLVYGEPLFIDAEEKDLSEAWVNSFAQTIYDAIGAIAIYYDYTANLLSKTWVKDTVWQAHYVAEGDYTKVRDLNVIMHQYSSDGQVPGVATRVDLNTYYGTAEEWKYLGRWGDDEIVQPEADCQPVTSLETDLAPQSEPQKNSQVKPQPEIKPKVPSKTSWGVIVKKILALFRRKQAQLLLQNKNNIISDDRQGGRR
jgi:GH25 family lysozyme M1 (1,4-beta-N-acetylmuramidase)